MGNVPEASEQEGLQQDQSGDERREIPGTIYTSGRLLFPDITELASRWLEELSKVGLPDKEQIRSLSNVLNQSSMDDPPDALSIEDVRSVRLSNGQVLRLHFNKAFRSRRGSRRVEVLDNARRTDMAIMAALIVLEGRSIKPETVRAVVRSIRLGDKGPEMSLSEGFQFTRLWNWAIYLNKHYRPGFEGRSDEEQIKLVEKTCIHVYDLLASLRKLLAFLEYGEPDQDTRPAVEAAELDIRAAMLKDVDNLKHREIAEELGIPLSEWARNKGDFSTVREMIKRGRGILKQAYGEKGWQRIAEALKADAEHWRALSSEEREAELTARSSWILEHSERALRLAYGPKGSN